MKLIKVIGNNAILVCDDKGEQFVAIGKGIGFGKRYGDFIDSSSIENLFYKKTGQLTNYFAQILSDVSPQVLMITEKIILTAKKELNIVIYDTLFLALCDHINFALRRYEQGHIITNFMLHDIKRLYKQEFTIGFLALNLINETFSVGLPEDEAGFIAMHIVNARDKRDMKDTIILSKIVKDVLSIVKFHLARNLDESSIDYNRFITHLKFFAQRVVSGKLENIHDSTIMKDIFVNFHDSSLCAKKVFEYVKSNYGYRLTDDEVGYLTIHIERLRKNIN